MSHLLTKPTECLYAQRRLRSADAQADLGFRWVHMPFCWFCHEVAHMAL